MGLSASESNGTDGANGRNSYAYIVEGDQHEFDPENWSKDPGELPRRHKETHVDVLIVGAGFGGLLTALECWRKGHNVVGVLERGRGPNYSGTPQTLTFYNSIIDLHA
jgi:NADPH-dependent 2,4-dienoyl-CoA reductase/sulfur reductase-like enzyme